MTPRIVVSFVAFALGTSLWMGQTPAADPMPEITVKEATYAQIETAIAANKGKVVVVDVWALTCAPCVKKFPHLVELHKTFGTKGLVTISVSTDFPEDTKDVIAFLKAKGATFPNFMLKDTEANEKKYEEKLPVFPQPMIWVFNRKGERILADEGKLKPDQLDALIQKALTEGA